MTEKDAAAQKRSEAAKKAAETRRKNAAAEEEDEKPEYEKESQEGDSPNADQQDGSDEKSDKAKGVKWNKQKRGISAGDVIDLECHRADVMPEDQQAQHEQRQRELAADRAVHNARTDGHDPENEEFDGKADRASWGSRK
jgi:hypothetical protein